MPPHLDHLLIGGGLAVGHPRTIDDDLQSLNFRVHTAWRKTKDRDVWHQAVMGKSKSGFDLNHD